MRGQIDVYGDLYLNMAESLPGKSSDNVLSDISTGNQTTLECAVCLQNCVHPAELPCGHIFCYLCIKGIVNRGRRCAMCRQDIPADYLDKPRLLNPVENDTESQAFTDGHSWFYEGHNGWWQYDVRTSMELETAYQNGERCCEVLVAGFLYVADFDSMLQYRRNDACKRRRIKRDLATTNKKGVAGLKVSKDTTPVNSSNIVSNVLISSMQNLNISNRPGSTTTSRASLPRQPSLIRPVSEQSGRSVHYRRHVMVPVYSNLNEDAQTSETESEVDSEDSLHSRGMVSAQALRNALYVALQRLYLLQIQLSHEYDYFTENAERFQNLQNGNRRSSERRPFGGMSASMSRLNRSLENELDISNRSPARTRLNRSEENVSSLEGNDFEWNGSNSPNPYQTDCFL